MIRINLLSSYKDYAAVQGSGGAAIFDEDERKQIIIDIAKRVAILAIGPVGLYIYEAQTIPVLTEAKHQADLKYDELKKFNDGKENSANEIKRYEDEQTRFNAQMDFINKIQADKLNEYKLFQHLKATTPATVWLNKLTLSNNNLNILGEATEPTDIAIFIDKLQNADFIATLVPANQSKSPDYHKTGVTTTLFELNATLKAGFGK
ncbi:MAG: PilN domain-containing protein [Pseudobdellovibrio sp.]